MSLFSMVSIFWFVDLNRLMSAVCIKGSIYLTLKFKKISLSRKLEVSIQYCNMFEKGITYTTDKAL